MEYIMINEEKLKVMLEQNDLAEWDISVEALDYSNPDAKCVFEEILQYARERFGFDTSGHKVLLQLYPSRDGGCELFITKLPRLKSGEQEKKEICEQKESIAFGFEKLSHMLAVCNRLADKEFYVESEAWADENGKWYLILSGTDVSLLDELPFPSDISFISEYGEAQSPRALSLYLGEHAKSICPRDAVETLGNL